MEVPVLAIISSILIYHALGCLRIPAVTINAVAPVEIWLEVAVRQFTLTLLEPEVPFGLDWDRPVIVAGPLGRAIVSTVLIENVVWRMAL